MKKILITMLMLLMIPLTTVKGSYEQPTNTYEHEFTSYGESHVISSPFNMNTETLSNATIEIAGDIYVDDGESMFFEMNYFDTGTAYKLVTSDFTIYFAYNTTAVDDTTIYGATIYLTEDSTFPLPFDLSLTIDAFQPIRPEIEVEEVIGNTFTIRVINYNDYTVSFCPNIYDADENLIYNESNQCFSLEGFDPDGGEGQNNEGVFEFDYVDWFYDTPYEYDSEYYVDGYFVKLFDSARYEASELSNRLLIETGFETDYDVTYIYDDLKGNVSGVNSAFPRDRLTITAEAYSGYYFAGWNVTVDGVTETFDYTDNPLYYTMPYDDLTVEAIFNERQTESGYKSFIYTIKDNGVRYAASDPEFFTQGRLSEAKIYIDDVLVVNNGVIVDDTVWLQYYDNPYLENAFELQELSDSNGFYGLMTISYGEGTNYSTDTNQGDVYVWFDEGELTTPFKLEILLPEVDPNPSIDLDAETDPDVPLNIQAALDLIGANNTYGYITLFAIALILVNLGLVFMKSSPIGYVLVNFFVSIIFINVGMLPFWASMLFIGFIIIAFIATIKGGNVSE